MLTITQAKQSDLEEACAVLLDAAQWLIDRGTPLWLSEEVSPDHMRPYLDRNELYLAKVAGETAGTILLQESDELFWPEIPEGSALFFHRLAVKRRFAGQGVATALIDHARQEAKIRGKTCLRMDCSAKHPKLRLFYESQGFRFLDQKRVDLPSARQILVDRLFCLIK